jgi:hypothetical protein
MISFIAPEQRVCDCQKAMLVLGSCVSAIGESMDNVTLIRVVAGILAVIVFVILIFRMKKKAPR